MNSKEELTKKNFTSSTFPSITTVGGDPDLPHTFNYEREVVEQSGVADYEVNECHFFTDQVKWKALQKRYHEKNN